MNYFIITYRVTIDNSITDFGVIGNVSPTTDHRPNAVKKAINNHYPIQYPAAKFVAIILKKIENVEKEFFMKKNQESLLIFRSKNMFVEIR